MAVDRIHPESIRQIQQLAKLHGVEAVKAVLDDYSAEQEKIARITQSQTRITENGLCNSYS
jgi:phage I-like protein